MTMQLRSQIWTFFSDDTSGETEFAGPQDPVAEAEKLDGFTQLQQQKQVSIAAAGVTPTTVALSMGNITTAKGLWLRATGSLSLVINGAVVPIAATKPTGAKYLRWYVDADITSVSVINAGATAVLLDYRLWA